MKVPYKALEIFHGTYEEDGPMNERKERWPKKGDQYYKANSEWIIWHDYYVSFISDIGILEKPRKATQEQLDDLKDARDFVAGFWDYLDEAWLKKAVAKAKSKKLPILKAFMEGFKETEGFKRFCEDYQPFPTDGR